MQYSFSSALRMAAPFCLLMMQPTAVVAQSVETPPSFNAAQIAGINRIGANYTIQNPVHSDGLLRIYVLTTPYGEITVQGDEMLRMRLNELAALALLEKVSNSESFGKAVTQAGLSPVVFTGRMIANPIGTVQSTLASVGGFFGRVGSGPMSKETGLSPLRSSLTMTFSLTSLNGGPTELSFVEPKPI